MKSILLPLFVLAFTGAGCLGGIAVTNFEDCVAAGYPVAESYPRQCSADGKTFIEKVGNAPEKVDLIRVTSPMPNEVIASPLTITGEARGTWFFEASFPVNVWDESGEGIGRGSAQATGDWMTEDFVPFTATVTFTVPEDTVRGNLMLMKDNPSGLPAYDDYLVVPVRFE